MPARRVERETPRHPRGLTAPATLAKQS